ncbi:MAG: 16S rRNA (cytosine(1402)-N(4))-methyltransferase RsmH [Parachlamydiaceae bacterium]
MHPSPHYPVLLTEVIDAFHPLLLDVVIDGTLGAGGHAQALLERHPEIQYYIGIDQDPEALSLAEDRLKRWSSQLILRHGNFSQFDQFLKQLSLPSASAILIDLGVSSMQLDQAARGFSFMREGPLDMRMNPLEGITAADIVNTWPEADLGKIFREYGEEKQWRAAARAIVKTRATHPFVTTQDLKNVLYPVLARFSKKGIHPLTLIFQALRICVNKELEVLETFLPKAIDSLTEGGRLAVISFHSLEDRIVKGHMRLAASDKWETSGLGGLFRDKEPTIKLMTKKPIESTDQEIHLNPRSRSAKLRVAEKVGKRL